MTRGQGRERRERLPSELPEVWERYAAALEQQAPRKQHQITTLRRCARDLREALSNPDYLNGENGG